jgi:hypothetical protein
VAAFNAECLAVIGDGETYSAAFAEAGRSQAGRRGARGEGDGRRPRTGGAPAASVVSASPDKVVVLLFVSQVTESTQGTRARVDQNRVRMTMDRTGDGWKVSAVDAL